MIFQFSYGEFVFIIIMLRRERALLRSQANDVRHFSTLINSGDENTKNTMPYLGHHIITQNRVFSG